MTTTGYGGHRHTHLSQVRRCCVIAALIDEYAGLEVNALTYWKPVKITVHAVQDAVELRLLVTSRADAFRTDCSGCKWAAHATLKTLLQ